MTSSDMTPPVELPDRRPEHQQVNAYGLTHPGKVRETNQDHFMTCSLRKFMQVHHTSVVERAEEHPSRRGMATTLCYVYREGELTQISRDQTMAQELVDDGVLTRSDADNTQWAHVLSSAIGGSQTAPVVSRMHDVWDTVGLLCSDGLTKHVSDARIKERLSTMTSAQQVCEDLRKMRVVHKDAG